ncbi:hypothetical protein ACFYSC_07205 [Streptosporangium sp. NPDC004379]|uniref:hypothetical protein n=1 Tax=Streptosporangium sp. NPDC004379 TaxID=3366189 RepID=UPI00369CE159
MKKVIKTAVAVAAFGIAATVCAPAQAATNSGIGGNDNLLGILGLQLDNLNLLGQPIGSLGLNGGTETGMPSMGMPMGGMPMGGMPMGGMPMGGIPMGAQMGGMPMGGMPLVVMGR